MTGRARRLAAVLVLAVAAAGVWSSRATWLQAMAETLVCKPGDGTADAVLIDNVDPNYLLFEAAQRLRTRGHGTVVIVPVLRSPWDEEPISVRRGMAELMCKVAGIAPCDTFETIVKEPISLHLAFDAANALEARGAHSVLLVTSGFRSKRSLEVYGAVLGPRGIAINCQPVFGGQDTSNWFDTGHGVEKVVLQLLKLWYYRIGVLPRAADAVSTR